VAILVPEATPRHVKIEAYNLAAGPVAARMTTWAIAPGSWRIKQGAGSRDVDVQRGSEIRVVFPPKQLSRIELDLTREGTPYWNRPDLGLSGDDVHLQGRELTVTVHSLGATDAPGSSLVVRNAAGAVLTSTTVPPLPSPQDVEPKTATVTLRLPSGASADRLTLLLETRGAIPEITLRNNQVSVPAAPEQPSPIRSRSHSGH
jgi:hypothetical protein